MKNLINRPVLMLDKGFQAYDAMPVHEAFGRVIADRATFVDENYTQYSISQWLDLPVDGCETIETARFPVRLPEVMRFPNHKLDHKRSKVMFNRKNLYKRDGYRCQYCGCKPRADEITIDHIVPQSKGGLSCFENCVLCCLRCNLKKADRTPEQAGMQLRRMVYVDGKIEIRFYHRPEHPQWNPMYSLPKLSVFPETWKNFLQMKKDELYWHVELLP